MLFFAIIGLFLLMESSNQIEPAPDRNVSTNQAPQSNLTIIPRSAWLAREPNGTLEEMRLPARRIVMIHTETQPCISQVKIWELNDEHYLEFNFRCSFNVLLPCEIYKMITWKLNRIFHTTSWSEEMEQFSRVSGGTRKAFSLETVTLKTINCLKINFYLCRLQEGQHRHRLHWIIHWQAPKHRSTFRLHFTCWRRSCAQKNRSRL